MARDEIGDIISSILQGGIAGLSEGHKAEVDSRKEMYKLIMGEQLKRKFNPEEVALKKAQAEQATGMAGLLKKYSEGGGLSGVGTDEDIISSQLPPGESKEDYIAKPIIKSIKGIPQRTTILERKEKVPPTALSGIKDLDSNIYDLQKNLDTLNNAPTIKQFIGPGIVQRPGAIADILTQFGYAPEGFATFKADVDKAFQKYRKWVTGVQAGYPELQWLVVDFPKPTDKPDIFISKSKSAIETMKQNREMFLDSLSANNYAVSNLRKLGGRPIIPPSQEPIAQYKMGDTRTIKGTTYQRNEAGQWLPTTR